MPPHVMMKGNLMEDTDVKAAMVMMMYGPIFEKYEDNKEIDPTGLLLMVLVNIVHHGSWMTCIVT